MGSRAKKGFFKTPDSTALEVPLDDLGSKHFIKRTPFKIKFQGGSLLYSKGLTSKLEKIIFYPEFDFPELTPIFFKGKNSKFGRDSAVGNIFFFKEKKILRKLDKN